MSECVTGRERGLRCFPALPGRPWCRQHDPDLAEERRASARKGALASHALYRVTPANWRGSSGRSARGRSPGSSCPWRRSGTLEHA